MRLLFDIITFVGKHLKNKDGVRLIKTCKRFTKIWKSYRHTEIITLSHIPNVIPIYWTYKFIIKSCNNDIITNISTIAKHTPINLTLLNCDDVTDVAALGSVHTLTLHKCKNITDVSTLGAVHTLTLYNCEKVTDVSALGTVHTLTLNNCHKIEDVSALGTVHTLTLNKCWMIADISALSTVTQLITDID